MTGMSFDPAFFGHELRVGLSYIPIVALLSIVPLICGLVLGSALALFRIYHVRPLDRFAQAYVVVMRSVPMLLQMFLFYYAVRGVYEALGLGIKSLDKVTVVLIALSFSAAGFLSEGVRTALISVENAGVARVGRPLGRRTDRHRVGRGALGRIQHLKREAIPMPHRVALASTSGKFIDAHFGRADRFAIFDLTPEGYAFVEVRSVERACGPEGHDECAFDAILDALSDCEAVLVSRIGMGAARYVRAKGMRVFEAP